MARREKGTKGNPARRRPAAADGSLLKAQGQLERRRGETGIPRAVDKTLGRVEKSHVTHDLRTWVVDLLAWQGYGHMAARVSGSGSRMPSIVLNGVDDPGGQPWVIAFDIGDNVRKMRSRSRAFSQMAGRYSALVLAARDQQMRLRVEIWDLDDRGQLLPDDVWLRDTAEQLARYLDAEVTVMTQACMSDRVQVAAPLPDELCARNSLAASWRWLRTHELSTHSQVQGPA